MPEWCCCRPARGRGGGGASVSIWHRIFYQDPLGLAIHGVTMKGVNIGSEKDDAMAIVIAT